MNQNTSLEDHLEAFGAMLRGRPPLTDRVMEQLRKSSADVSAGEPSTPGPRAMARRWRQLLTAAASVAVLSVALFSAMILLRSPSVGWAEVTKTIQSQKWIRGTYSDGRTMWLAPERQIWAFKLDDSFYFFDGQERVKYEYHGNDKPIVRLPLGEDDAQKVLPIAALSQDKGIIGHWLLGTEKIVQQERLEVTEAGETWIEFKMVLWRGDMNRATLRVDPKTKLPVYILCASPDRTKSLKLRFDYPADGPTDIYSLGVPREVEIRNRVPSDHALQVLDAMAASRARIGNFRLLVAEEGDHRTFVVSRKGELWRVDSCGDFNTVIPPTPADGQAVSDWFAQRLRLSPRIPLYLCDGKTVYMNRESGLGDTGAQWQIVRSPAPPDLMSGQGLGMMDLAPGIKFASLLYPELTPRRGWPFEFDPQPAHPPGCVLIKRSARLATQTPQVAHEWYYVDPARGHAVVRAELFNLPADTPPQASQSRQIIRMEDFQRSPHGFWYPTVIHSGTIPNTVRYEFDFDAELPDSLFTVAGGSAPD